VDWRVRTGGRIGVLANDCAHCVSLERATQRGPHVTDQCSQLRPQQAARVSRGSELLNFKRVRVVETVQRFRPLRQVSTVGATPTFRLHPKRKRRRLRRRNSAAGTVVAAPNPTNATPNLRRRSSENLRETKSPTPNASAARVATMNPNLRGVRTNFFIRPSLRCPRGFSA
jgi:hypothetical protein